MTHCLLAKALWTCVLLVSFCTDRHLWLSVCVDHPGVLADGKVGLLAAVVYAAGVHHALRTVVRAEMLRGHWISAAVVLL